MKEQFYEAALKNNVSLQQAKDLFYSSDEEVEKTLEALAEAYSKRKYGWQGFTPQFYEVLEKIPHNFGLLPFIKHFINNCFDEEFAKCPNLPVGVQEQMLNSIIAEELLQEFVKRNLLDPALHHLLMRKPKLLAIYDVKSKICPEQVREMIKSHPLLSSQYMEMQDFGDDEQVLLIESGNFSLIKKYSSLHKWGERARALIDVMMVEWLMKVSEKLQQVSEKLDA